MKTKSAGVSVFSFQYLRNVEGFKWNHKRVYRVYRELEMNLRIKPRKRIRRGKPDALEVPSEPNRVWSMDFMSDSLCDNGPEYISTELTDWARDREIELAHIQPGKPTQNAYVERFNRTVRHEWLELVNFESIEQAQFLATDWQWSYNNERPNSAIGGIPPRMKSLIE